MITSELIKIFLLYFLIIASFISCIFIPVWLIKTSSGEKQSSNGQSKKQKSQQIIAVIILILALFVLRQFISGMTTE